MRECVSIIMPAHNASKHLNEAISSVRSQTYTNWELLICDDGSTDDTARIVQLAAKSDARILSIKNVNSMGAANARNKCLEHASGRYVAFLDADDIWLPQKLERQIQFIAETKQPFVFGYCENISENGKVLSTVKAPKLVSFSTLLFGNFSPCLTRIYDTTVLGKVEQPDIKKRNDFALWIRILRKKRGIKARCCPEVVARYRVNSYGLSSNKISTIKYFYRCLRQYADLGPMSAGFYTLCAIVFKGVKTLSPQMYNVVVTRFF